MALKLSCADTGADCPFEVVASTKDELMEHVGVHARTAHPELAANPPAPEMIEKLVKQV